MHQTKLVASNPIYCIYISGNKEKNRFALKNIFMCCFMAVIVVKELKAKDKILATMSP